MLKVGLVPCFISPERFPLFSAVFACTLYHQYCPLTGKVSLWDWRYIKVKKGNSSICKNLKYLAELGRQTLHLDTSIAFLKSIHCLFLKCPLSLRTLLSGFPSLLNCTVAIIGAPRAPAGPRWKARKVSMVVTCTNSALLMENGEKEGSVPSKKQRNSRILMM